MKIKKNRCNTGFPLHLDILVMKIVGQGTGHLPNLLNSPTVLFKVNTHEKVGFLPVRHNSLPKGAALFLLEPAS